MRKARALQALEVSLYVLFLLDCFALTWGAASAASWEPPAGAGLIVLLLLAAVVRRARVGHEDY